MKTITAVKISRLIQEMPFQELKEMGRALYWACIADVEGDPTDAQQLEFAQKLRDAADTVIAGEE